MNATIIVSIIVALLIILPVLILYANIKRHQEYREKVIRKMNGLEKEVAGVYDEVRMANEAFFFHALVDHFNFLIHLKLETKFLSTYVNNEFLLERLYETIVLTLSRQKGIDVLRLRSVYPCVAPQVLEYTLISASDILQGTHTDTEHLIDGNFKIILDFNEYDIQPLIDELLTTFVQKQGEVITY